ncbi:hypothetical protein [Lysobacter hankyongensis]|uniref:Uncharacterized protein n=1 Tax=Lysobacter hankyongensis TaxID=1176535 RepID=A0ABP9B517_9GAMM
MNGAGGTPGGIGQFFIGLMLAVAGGWLLTNQVTVTTGGYWHLWGMNGFGLSLIPFILGTGLIFFNGKSIVGWLLLAAGLVIVFVGILSNLRIYFEPTSLFNTLLMLGLLAAGLGMMAASLRTRPAEKTKA